MLNISAISCEAYCLVPVRIRGEAFLAYSFEHFSLGLLAHSYVVTLEVRYQPRNQIFYQSDTYYL